MKRNFTVTFDKDDIVIVTNKEDLEKFLNDINYHCKFKVVYEIVQDFIERNIVGDDFNIDIRI